MISDMMTITFCAGTLCTLFGMLLCMPSLIKVLHRLKFGQTEREEGLDSHKKKAGTPTMGGIAFILVPLAVFCVLALMFPALNTIEAWICWISYLGFGVIGFIDDYIIVVQKNNQGLKPWIKFGLQSLLAVAVFLLCWQSGNTSLYIPVVKVSVDLSWLYLVLVFFMFTGSSNAVNLTDGVDGLCAGLVCIALVPFFVIAAIAQNWSIMQTCLLVMAGLLGYLFFNLHPAKIFMGDTGSLALGGLLAALALVLHSEIIFVVVAGVFIAETVSDIIQVLHYKRTKTRVFLMAPLHHHYEKKGWSEDKVVRVFWMWGIVFALCGILLAVL